MFDVIEQNGAVLGFGVAFLLGSYACCVSIPQLSGLPQAGEAGAAVSDDAVSAAPESLSVDSDTDEPDGGMPEAGRCADGGDHETGV